MSQLLEKVSWVSLQRFFFAGALNRGICSSQDRPHCGLKHKLSYGADEQAGYVGLHLVQHRHGKFYTHSS
jgi:hypothetical protein